MKTIECQHQLENNHILIANDPHELKYKGLVLNKTMLRYLIYIFNYHWLKTTVHFRQIYQFVSLRKNYLVLFTQ